MELPTGLRTYIASDKVARDYDRYHEDSGLFELDVKILDRAFGEPGDLLDLGCGTGRHLVHFARRGFTVTGVDLSASMLDVTGRKLAEEQIDARLLQDDIRELKTLPDASFDYVICMFSTIGMIPGSSHRRSVVRQACRVLRPGGRFAVHVHNRLYHWRRLSGLMWLLGSYLGRRKGFELGDKDMSGYRNIPALVLHLFSRRELKALLRDAGFVVERIVSIRRGRDAELRIPVGRNWRSNGFIAVARKGESSHLSGHRRRLKGTRTLP